MKTHDANQWNAGADSNLLLKNLQKATSKNWIFLFRVNFREKFLRLDFDAIDELIL